MKEKIEEFNKLKESLMEEMKIWCIDKSIPLEERWDLFMMASDFIDTCQDKLDSEDNFECDLDEVKEYFLSIIGKL